MSQNKKPSICPCCSGKEYEICCLPYHRDHSKASDIVKLMRSRYSAFVLHKEEHLRQTWYITHRPNKISTSETGIQWKHLTIENSSYDTRDPALGWVTFTAIFLQEGKLYGLHEKSCFIKENHWYYKDGETKIEELNISKNAGCPCRSGKKFKRCCGKK